MLQDVCKGRELLNDRFLSQLPEVSIRRTEEQLRRTHLALYLVYLAEIQLGRSPAMISDSVELHVVAHCLTMQQVNLFQHVGANVARILVRVRYAKSERLRSVYSLPPKKTGRQTLFTGIRSHEDVVGHALQFQDLWQTSC